MNSGRSNVKLRGSNNDEILQFFYPQKADETRNPIKLESSDSDLRSGRNPYFKVSKNLNQIWAKMKNKTTSKANLNTNCCKMNDRFTLLTRLT